MQTNFPKIFPYQSLKALVEILQTPKRPKTPDLETFRQVNRHAAFSLGCLLTLYKGSLPPNLDDVKAPSTDLVTLGASILEQSGEKAVHNCQAVSPDEVIYLVSMCQQAQVEFTNYAAPVAPVAPDEPTTPK